MDQIRKNVSILYRQLMIFLNRELEGTEINAVELIYLDTLYRKDGITQDDLAQECCIDKAATTRTMQVMEEKGLITRRISITDKRAKIVFLTQKAKEYVAFIRQIQQKWIREIDVELTEQEMQTFVRVLSIVAKKAKQINQDMLLPCKKQTNLKKEEQDEYEQELQQ